MSTLLSLSIATIAGVLLARLFKPLNLPSVTAYLIAGVLVGPFFLGKAGVDGLGFVSMEYIENLSLFSDVALGFIAFSIGNEFKLESLKKIGKQAVVIGIAQAAVTTAIVDAVLIFLATKGMLTIAQAIVLGAIATATAPAATLMVVRQFKAKGETVDLLLPIVALDDAVGLVVFSVSFGIAKAISSGFFDINAIIVEPLAEIVFSLSMGAVLGYFLAQGETEVFSKKEKSNKLVLLVCFVLLAVGLSKSILRYSDIDVSFSSLLVCMMMGCIYCNLDKHCDSLMADAEEWQTGLMALFFVISGAELDLNVLNNKIFVELGIIYIVSRCVGKYLGAYISARATHVSPLVSKYLGITLFPQAGVALGMCVTARTLGAEGEMISNIILFAILIYELVGPMLTKIALTKTGDISTEILNSNKKDRDVLMEKFLSFFEQ